jgi:hypothetical protein
MWTRNLFVGLVVLLSFTVIGQTYSNDREKFVKEFQKQLSEYGKGESKSFAKNLLPAMLLESSDMPDKYFNKMVATCNILVEKRFKPYPEIYHYIYSVYSFVEKKQSTDSYDAWHESIDKLADYKIKEKFTSFIEFSAGFFSESRIASSSDFDWYYTGGNYNFEFQKNAIINFSGGDLSCRVSSSKAGKKVEILDSIHIMNTKGVYDPALKKWKGSEGKITWARVGLSAETTFAELSYFDVSMTKSTITIDTVLLTTPYFDAPIKGRLMDRAFKISREVDKKFPQFLSFQQKLIIKEIVPNVDYVGGFEMQGQNFYGTGSSSVPSQITVKHNGAPFIFAKSKQIIVQKDRIKIDQAETSVYLNSGDSIYHPGIDFLYDFEKKNVILTRSNSGLGQAAFVDSYHQLNILVPKIIWNVGEENLALTYEFGTGREQRVGRFESNDFFDERLYDRLQGLSRVHPLVSLANYSYKYDEEVINEGKAASALGMEISQAKSILIELSNLGFITYDSEEKRVQINDKLLTFVEAKAGTADYDNIAFVSDLTEKIKPTILKEYSQVYIDSTPDLHYLDSIYDDMNNKRRLMKDFASFDLVSLNLSIGAVDVVDISKSNHVLIIPDGNEVLVRKNRDFNFSGWFYAGKIEMDVVAASFEYDDFKVKLFETNESVFRVSPRKKEHGPGLVKMVSSISGISGEVLIDEPTNKSGKNGTLDHFPRLISTSKSKVFYNSDDTYRGVYDSTRFYYTLDTFSVYRLNTFIDTSLNFTGELTSAGIFPVIRKEIKIMPDYSFGFLTEAPTGGYRFYGTDAKYENRILLSHQGLQGAGTINFINSTSVSKSLLSFLPDSTVGVVSFLNRPSETGIQFPPVSSDEAYITYVPNKNILKASSMPKNDLEFFGGEANLRGTLQIRPNGMTGKGLMSFERATLISENFNYKRWDIDADTASFSLKNDDEDYAAGEDPLAFNTANVNSHISFEDRTGVFNSNEGESEVYFPVNQYMCRMDKFTWFMDEFEVEMERQDDKDMAIEAGIDLKGPNFYSTHPKQDSLQFKAPKAKFDIKRKTIYCNEVEYVDIADARIYPDSMKINIRKKAKIDKLVNSRVVANYVTQFHKFEDAEVEILARRKYKAQGVYSYFDLDSNVFYIAMNDIEPDSSFQTRGSGKIEVEENFKLSPQFDYYGKVAVHASNPLIFFDGATRINHECNKFDRNWMSFASQIDPKNIQIPVQDNMKDLEGGAISAGIVWRDSPVTDSLGLYPTFLSSLLSPKDPIVMTASGFLQYNDGAKEFQIGSKEKLINRKEKGNFIALHTESCSMNGDGEIELGMNFGEVDIDAVGIVNYDQNTGETSMSITAKYMMKIDKGLLQDVAERINDLEGLKRMDFNSTTLEQAILQWDDLKTADDFKSKYTIDPTSIKKAPGSLGDAAFTITGIRLSSFKSDMQETGLITNVQSAVLVNMYGKPVMKYVPFRAFYQQIYSGGGGDKFSALIDIPGGMDYMFSYEMVKKDGLMLISTGDAEFSAAISEMKEDKLKSKNFKYEVTSNPVIRKKLFDLFIEK